MIIDVICCIDDGETGDLRPSKGDRIVELQRSTDTEGTGQLQDQAR